MRFRAFAVLLAVGVIAAGVVSGGAAPASGATPQSILGDATPRVVHDPDTVPVTVGMVVSFKSAGDVSALRFYKGAQNAGTHIGLIYSSDGRELSRATFTRESGSGWQSVVLDRPLRVSRGQSVTVAVYMPRGRYSVTNPYGWPVETTSLSASRGVYAYGSSPQYPGRSYQASNYFVDLTFASAQPEPSTSPSTTASPRPTASPTSTATSRPTASPTTTTTRPSVPATATPSATMPTSSTSQWPDATNTGVAGCPALEKVNNGDEVRLASAGQVYENKELLNPAVIRVVANNVTIRCVKLNGSGWFGIDNTDLRDVAANAEDTRIDRVEISCQNRAQRIGILAKSATISRTNVYACDHFLNAGGDNLVIKDNYCHDLTDLPVVHADCIQTMGGNTNMLIEHNSLWSRDTSDILLGQEFGDAKNVVINNNRLMSVGNPPPAYLLYLSGTNTRVTNNRFTRRYTYGACTLNTKNPVVWSGNVWDDDGSPMNSCGSR